MITIGGNIIGMIGDPDGVITGTIGGTDKDDPIFTLAFC